MNTLYYGDNLNILREYIKDESVDLIYLDPPFNSNRNYNVLFKDESGTDSQSQITAFEDTWHWNLQAEQTYNELISEPDQVGRMIESFRQFIGTNQMMAYLTMMAIRLKELHRVLKPIGSLYLHCDPTASHYLKVLLDTTFGVENFRNEIIWKRTTSKSLMSRRLPSNHDVILAYQKTPDAIWNEDAVFEPYDEDNLDEKTISKYSNRDEDGRLYTLGDLTNPNPNRPNLTYEFLGMTKVWRWTKERMLAAYEAGLVVQPRPGAVPRFKRYLNDMRGKPLGDVWTDIFPINSQAQERLGYPTQKPVALLERIVAASSNEGDIVLDPFCGCGTTIAAAQKLNRQWIGIDITHLSVGLQKLRLRDTFGLLPLGERASVSSSVSSVVEIDGTQNSQNKDTETTEPNPQQYYRVIGQPEDLAGAKELADKDKYGFQWWVLPLIGAKAFGSEAGKKVGKKGADGGIDGMIVFTDDNSGKAKRVIVSVKGGGVNVSHIRDLVGTVEREKAAIGVYLTLEPPTKPMLKEATEAGFYHSEGWNRDYPKIQILTVEDILNGKQPDLPPSIATFKQAERVSKVDTKQESLRFD